MEAAPNIGACGLWAAGKGMVKGQAKRTPFSGTCARRLTIESGHDGKALINGLTRHGGASGPECDALSVKLHCRGQPTETQGRWALNDPGICFVECSFVVPLPSHVTCTPTGPSGAHRRRAPDPEPRPELRSGRLDGRTHARPRAPMLRRCRCAVRGRNRRSG